VPKPALAIGGDLTQVITKISNALLLLVGLIAVLFLIIGGFQLISSAGNADNINKGKHTIFYAIIGLIIALLSYASVSFIVSQF